MNIFRKKKGSSLKNKYDGSGSTDQIVYSTIEIYGSNQKIKKCTRRI